MSRSLDDRGFRDAGRTNDGQIKASRCHSYCKRAAVAGQSDCSLGWRASIATAVPDRTKPALLFSGLCPISARQLRRERTIRQRRSIPWPPSFVDDLLPNCNSLTLHFSCGAPQAKRGSNAVRGKEFPAGGRDVEFSADHCRRSKIDAGRLHDHHQLSARFA